MKNRIIGLAIAAAGAIGAMIGNAASGANAGKLITGPGAAFDPAAYARWNGFKGLGRHASSRFVAQDKRDAQKRRNRLRNRMAHR